MKIQHFILVAAAAVLPAIACAQSAEKTEECLRNVSRVHSLVNAKQFQEAYEPWYTLYTDCPDAHKSIYTNGAKIIDYYYEHATDPAEKQRLAQLALDLCDKRIQYFGDDKKYPTAYILGEKGLEYVEHFPEDEVKAAAYPWFKASIEGMGIRSKITVLMEFLKVSYNLYRTDPERYGEQFLTDYTTVSGYLQTMAEDNTNKNASAAAQQKDVADNLFALSGAANCDQLDRLYVNEVQENSTNMEQLQKIMKLYKHVNCSESDVYFAAAEYAHKMQPTEESAAGCAKMCMKKEDWRGAIDYYNQALTLIEEDEDEDKDDYLYNIALIYYDKLKNPMEARRYARMSLDANADQGRCFILIGLCYTQAKPYSDKDYPAAKAAILNKTVYWAAVDKFQRAKQVEPACTDDANRLIAAYSKYFPTKEDMFDLPNEFSEGMFIVGGWINEKTVCRAAH